MTGFAQNWLKKHGYGPRYRLLCAADPECSPEVEVPYELTHEQLVGLLQTFVHDYKEEFD